MNSEILSQNEHFVKCRHFSTNWKTSERTSRWLPHLLAAKSMICFEPNLLAQPKLLSSFSSHSKICFNFGQLLKDHGPAAALSVHRWIGSLIRLTSSEANVIPAEIWTRFTFLEYHPTAEWPSASLHRIIQIGADNCLLISQHFHLYFLKQGIDSMVLIQYNWNSMIEHSIQILFYRLLIWRIDSNLQISSIVVTTTQRVELVVLLPNWSLCYNNAT